MTQHRLRLAAGTIALLLVATLVVVPGAARAATPVATAISAGGLTTCAILDDETVRCWGSNSNGQLGDGTTTDRSTPVPVSGITSATAVDVGTTHACALLGNATVMCWGSNDAGQLGDGSLEDRHTPVAVVGISTAVAVAAGPVHS